MDPPAFLVAVLICVRMCDGGCCCQVTTREESPDDCILSELNIRLDIFLVSILIFGDDIYCIVGKGKERTEQSLLTRTSSGTYLCNCTERWCIDNRCWCSLVLVALKVLVFSSSLRLIFLTREE